MIVLRFRGLVVQRTAILMVVDSLNKLLKNNWVVANGGNSGWKTVLNTPIERNSRGARKPEKSDNIKRNKSLIMKLL